jgi:hypothetical protein
MTDSPSCRSWCQLVKVLGESSCRTICPGAFDYEGRPIVPEEKDAELEAAGAAKGHHSKREN